MLRVPKLIRHIRLSYRHLWLLARAFSAVLSFRLLLWIFRYRQIAGIIKLAPPKSSSLNPELAAWAIFHTARVVPGASCLTQALALQHLLAGSGTKAIVRIGVAFAPGQQRDAHAWVLVDDRILLGGTEDSVKGYAVLTDLVPSV